MEYLITMTTQVQTEPEWSATADVRAREAARSRELAVQRHLLRLWRPPLQPGESRTLGAVRCRRWAVGDGPRLDAAAAWRTDEVTPLTEHPNDPRAGQPVIVVITDLRRVPLPGRGARRALVRL